GVIPGDDGGGEVDHALITGGSKIADLGPAVIDPEDKAVIPADPVVPIAAEHLVFARAAEVGEIARRSLAPIVVLAASRRRDAGKSKIGARLPPYR
ncbi:MAG: hypothetical protein AAFR17_14590, partial [Pseudomonadota bacterium]